MQHTHSCQRTNCTVSLNHVDFISHTQVLRLVEDAFNSSAISLAQNAP